MKNSNAVCFLILFVVFLLILAAILQPSPKGGYTGGGYTSDYNRTSGYRPSSTPKPSEKPAPKPTAKPSTQRTDITPSLDTEGFYHPEDFYDWNRDDFSDYEEAEEYYYSHGGW
jgi:hypothetical protein